MRVFVCIFERIKFNKDTEKWQNSCRTLTLVVKCCIKMLSATMVLFACMTFKSAALDLSTCWCCCCCCWLTFRLVLSGIGETFDSVFGSVSLLKLLPSCESMIENSIKFSFNSPLANDLVVFFDLTCGTATALLAAGIVVDDLPLRWIDAIIGWWSSFNATGAAAVAAAGGNFVVFVPLFVLWLLLLMLLLLLLFIVGGCASVVCSPCSKHFENGMKKNQDEKKTH